MSRISFRDWVRTKISNEGVLHPVTVRVWVIGLVLGPGSGLCLVLGLGTGSGSWVGLGVWVWVRVRVWENVEVRVRVVLGLASVFGFRSCAAIAS